MGKDPAFLFYPGDYLKDTQCLSEKAQVAYDRIMCEHMRNICISKQRLDFFTKRLTDDEKEEILSVMEPISGGFHILWVSQSIEKRKAYSDSRRKNRNSKKGNICQTYVRHMENENENESKDVFGINTNPTTMNIAQLEWWDVIKGLYPNIMGIGKAENTFILTIRNQLTYKRLRTSVENYKAELELNPTTFVIHFGNFMDRWGEYENHKPVKKEQNGSGKTLGNAIQPTKADIATLENLR